MDVHGEEADDCRPYTSSDTQRPTTVEKESCDGPELPDSPLTSDEIQYSTSTAAPGSSMNVAETISCRRSSHALFSQMASS